MRKFLIKTVLILLSECLTTDLALFLIGLINKYCLRERLNTAILFYFANHKYAESITFPWYASRIKWVPRLGGVFIHGEGGGVILVMGSREEDFSSQEGLTHLRDVNERMQRIAKLLHVKSVSYSGVLRSVLAKAGVRREPIERQRTVHWVLTSIDRARAITALPADSPVVILGAAGFIGAKVVEQLRFTGSACIIQIDPAHPDPECRGIGALEAIGWQRSLIVNNVID